MDIPDVPDAVAPAEAAARVGRGKPTPKKVLERRLVFVNTAWERGMSTYQIRQAIATAAAKERDEWHKHRADANHKPPLLVWGEHPPGDRTIDDYLSRVAKAHEAEGNELSKRAALHMGKQLARLESGYAKAVADDDGLLALRFLREIAKFLGINAAAAVKIGGIDNAEPIKTQDVPMAPHTEEGVYSIMEAIIAKGKQRVAERRRQEAEG